MRANATVGRRPEVDINLEPRNRALTDIVAAGDAALRLASVEAMRASFCWCGVRIGLRPNLTPFSLASARPRAVRSRMRRRSSFAATPRMAKTISAKSDVVSRNGSASERIPAPARCMSRAITRRSVVSRDRRSTAGVITTSPGASSFISCGKLRPVGRGAGDFLAEHLFASGRFQLAHLSGFVLGGGRDAGIAVNHVFDCASEICIKKAQFDQGRGDDADILPYASCVGFRRRFESDAFIMEGGRCKLGSNAPSISCTFTSPNPVSWRMRR